MEKARTLTQPILLLLLCMQSAQSFALSCRTQAHMLSEAQAIFSVIPMQGELLLERDLTEFEVDVRHVWKGTVNRTETIRLEMPRMLSLGDEYILAVGRDLDGVFHASRCSPVIPAHKQELWIEENLGAPIYEYRPDILG